MSVDFSLNAVIPAVDEDRFFGCDFKLALPNYDVDNFRVMSLIVRQVCTHRIS